MTLDVNLTCNKVSETQSEITGTISDIPVNFLTASDFSTISEVPTDSDWAAIRNTLNLLIAKTKGSQ